jgi:hypothetical protein
LKLSEPLPADGLGQRLCTTFPYLWQPIIATNEPDAQWKTITKYPLRPRVLWAQWQDAAQLVGVRFDHTTRYGMVDLDISSPYHPNQGSDALPLIRAALETIGIYRSILIRSSWSGGFHLYLPLPAEVPTFGLAIALKQCLEAQGLQLGQGKLETFPNVKTYAKPGTYIEYNAHRLPLQPASGSFLLDGDYNPIGADLTQFFHQWDQASASQDLAELHQAIATAKTNRKTRTKQKPIVAEWQRDLQTEITTGWTDHGQTNHLLKTIACYGVVFEGRTGDDLSDYVHQTAIALPGYAQWCRHQHEIELRSRVWASAAAGYYWKLGNPPKRTGNLHSEPANTIVPFNLARSQEAQQRIRAAVDRLETEGTLPATATQRATAISQQGISLKTLYRHLDLWHPKHLPTSPPGSDDLGDQRKIPEPAGVSQTSPDLIPTPPISSKSNTSAEFYTPSKNMKGMPLQNLSSHSPILDSDQPPPASHVPTVTPPTFVSPLQLLLQLESELRSQSSTVTSANSHHERSP